MIPSDGHPVPAVGKHYIVAIKVCERHIGGIAVMAAEDHEFGVWMRLNSGQEMFCADAFPLVVEPGLRSDAMNICADRDLVLGHKILPGLFDLMCHQSRDGEGEIPVINGWALPHV